MSRWCDCRWHSPLKYPNDFGLVGAHLIGKKNAKIWVMGDFEGVTKVCSAFIQQGAEMNNLLEVFGVEEKK